MFIALTWACWLPSNHENMAHVMGAASGVWLQLVSKGYCRLFRRSTGLKLLVTASNPDVPWIVNVSFQSLHPSLYYHVCVSVSLISQGHQSLHSRTTPYLLTILKLGCIFRALPNGSLLSLTKQLPCLQLLYGERNSSPQLTASKNWMLPALTGVSSLSSTAAPETPRTA